MLIKDSKRSIGQAAKEVGIPEYVIRYWETQFPNHIQPTVGLGGRRYYYNKDIKILSNIKNYLYTKGYTIKGLQNFLLNNNFEETENILSQENIYQDNKNLNTYQNVDREIVLKPEKLEYENKPIVQKEYVYIDKGLDSETKVKLNNFQNNLINFGIQLENFEGIS